MGRNLYIFAGTLVVFAVVCLAVSFTNIAQQPGSPGDTALWRTMSIAFVLIAMIVGLAGIFSSMFEQAERRAEEARRNRRAEEARRKRP